MATDIRFYVLVTGRTHNNGFSNFAHNLAKEIARDLVAKKQTWTARFLHFDCWSNQVEVGDFDPADKGDQARGRPRWTPLKSYKPAAGDAHQDPKSFVDTTKHTMAIFEDGKTKTVHDQFSITNVYHTVRGAPDGSVMEISFMSHGFADGPVLVNTSISPNGLPLVPQDGVDKNGKGVIVPAWDQFPGNLPKRWDGDGDGRMGDFADNMGEDPAVEGADLALDGVSKLKSGGKGALDQFKGALNTAARMRILGCDVQEIAYEDNVRQTLKSTVLEVLDAAVYKQIGPRVKGKRVAATKLGQQILAGTVAAGQALTFDLQDQFVNETQDTEHYTVQDTARLRVLHLNTDLDFFANVPAGSTKVTTTWAELVKFVAGQASICYQFLAADALGIDVIATPLGTSGEIDEKKAPDKMVACGNIDRCTAITQFYAQYLDLPVAEDGYSLFNSTSTAKITQHAQ